MPRFLEGTLGPRSRTLVSQPLQLQIRETDGSFSTCYPSATTWSVAPAFDASKSSPDCDDASPALDYPAVDALEKVERVLVDSGTRYDMVARKVAKFYPDAIFKTTPTKLATANGVVVCNKALLMHYPKLVMWSPNHIY